MSYLTICLILYMYACHFMTQLPQKMIVGAYVRHSFWLAVEIVENRSTVSSGLTIEYF